MTVKLMKNKQASQSTEQNHDKSKHSNNADIVLEKVRSLLNDGRAREALEVLRRAHVASRDLQNAYGVCLMRLGEFAEAIQIFRKLVLPGGGFNMISHIPIHYKTNFALSLLVGGHADGCVGVLNEINDDLNPGVARIRAAILRWKRTINPLRRLFNPLLGLPDRAVPIDFPLGEV